jgi:hypothetical protein
MKEGGFVHAPFHTGLRQNILTGTIKKGGLKKGLPPLLTALIPCFVKVVSVL